MSEQEHETTLTSTGSEEPMLAPADLDSETDEGSDLERETIDQEIKGYPDQPTTS